MARFSTWMLALALASGVATANDDELLTAVDGLCKKMQGCVMQSMGEVPPEMRPMMEQMAAGMCTNIRSGYTQYAATTHPLYAPATACINSMQAQSCAQLQQQPDQTPECARYEELRKQHPDMK